MIKHIKQLSFYGFASLIGGFILSIAVLIGMLFNYDSIKKEGHFVSENYNHLLQLKESSERLLTTNNLENETKRWQELRKEVDKALQKVGAIDSPVISSQIGEVNRLWRIVQKEASNVDAVLANPLLGNRNTIDKPVLRRLGENYQKDTTNDFFVALYDLTNHVGSMTQYEHFLLENFTVMLEMYRDEEQKRLDSLKNLIILLPTLVMFFSILFSVYISRWINRIEAKLLNTQESLRDSLKKFTYLVNTTMESILILQDEKCIDVNDECLRMFGFKSKDEVIGMSAFDFVTEGTSRQIAREKIAQDRSDPYEAEALRPDGTTFPALIKGHNFQTSEGKIRIAAIMDLTDLKASEAALKRLNENLHEEVQKQLAELRQKDDLLMQQSKLASLGEMLSNIAHQWRQPLNALALNIQDVTEAYTFNELDAAYLEKVTKESMKQIQFMSKTIDDFRNFFSSEQTAVPFNLAEEIKKVTDIVHAQLENHGISLEISGNHVTIIGLTNDFKQVILNILNNARDAIINYRKTTEWFQGRILISIKKEEKNIFVEISDNGGGISEKIIDRIFEPYFTTKFKSLGTGIGLYMAKTIIEKNMNGDLWAENIQNGAKFTIKLPQ